MKHLRTMIACMALALCLGAAAPSWAADVTLDLDGAAPAGTSLADALADWISTPGNNLNLSDITSLTVTTGLGYEFSAADWNYIKDNRSSLTSLQTLHLGVVTLGSGAGDNKVPADFLRNNGSIQSVVLPIGVTEIGVDAFNGCGRLESFLLPESVKKVGDNAFNPSGLTRLETWAPTPPPGMSWGNNALPPGAVIIVNDGNAKTEWEDAFPGLKNSVFVPMTAGVNVTDVTISPATNPYSLPIGGSVEITVTVTTNDAIPAPPLNYSIDSGYGKLSRGAITSSQDGKKHTYKFTLTALAVTGLDDATKISFSASGANGSREKDFTYTVTNAAPAPADPDPVPSESLSVYDPIAKKTYTLTKTNGVWQYTFPEAVNFSDIAVTYTTNGVVYQSVGSFESGVEKSVETTSANGAKKTVKIKLTVKQAALPLAVTVTPAKAQGGQGGSRTFTAEATGGAAPYTYAWFKDNGDAVLATGATCTIANLSGADSGTYTCKVTDSKGATASASGTLSVGNITVEATGTTIDSATIKVTLTDELGNPVSGESIELILEAMEGAAFSRYAGVRTGADGTATWTFTDLNAMRNIKYKAVATSEKYGAAECELTVYSSNSGINTNDCLGIGLGTTAIPAMLLLALAIPRRRRK